jgi:hypothetical protein
MIDFTISRLLIIYVDYVLGLLHRVVIDNFGDISDVHVATILKL